jgi:hypothetical protein
MSSIKLNWASAEVEDARLTVGLAGDLPKGWKQSFERTVTLLGDGEWGDVRVKKGTIHVAEVTPGTEDKLRHHLESIVAQANADHEADDAPDGDDEPHDEQPDGPDAEMTERFRSYEQDDEAG